AREWQREWEWQRARLFGAVEIRPESRQGLLPPGGGQRPPAAQVAVQQRRCGRACGGRPGAGREVRDGNQRRASLPASRVRRLGGSLALPFVSRGSPVSDRFIHVL